MRGTRLRWGRSCSARYVASPARATGPSWLVTAGRSHYGHLLAAGVRLFEYSAGIHHAKIALADDPWAMVGSANLDYRSMRLNFEPNLLIHSREGNGELARILEQDFGLCQEIDPVVFSHRAVPAKIRRSRAPAPVAQVESTAPVDRWSR